MTTLPSSNSATSRALLVTMLLIGTCNFANATGRILVAGDDWPFFDEAFSQTSDTYQFATNVASWFTDGLPGDFLSTPNFSATRGTGELVINTIQESGNSWTVNNNLATLSLENLLEYDGLFLGETTVIPEPSLLTDYVNAGGSIYLYGTGVGNDPTRWNEFLREFGLAFGEPYSGKEVFTIDEGNHPVFADVAGLYFWNGVAIIDEEPNDARSHVFYTDRHAYGIFGIWDPDPTTFLGARSWSIHSGGNGHYYEHVTSNLRWEEARLAASNRSFKGLSGHLVTITSDAENRFVASLFPSTQRASWIGANDIDEEGVWVWADGPESGNSITLFTAWDHNEPNNSNNEDAVGMWGPANGGGPRTIGTWNDFATQDRLGYIVEYSTVEAEGVTPPPEEPNENVSPPTLRAFWDFNDNSIPERASDRVGEYSGDLLNGLQFSNDGEGRSGQPGDRCLDFGRQDQNKAFRSRSIARVLNSASRDQSLTVAFWQQWNGPTVGSVSFWFVVPSGRVFQAHVPWAGGRIYFDVPSCRVSEPINSFTDLDFDQFFMQWHHFAFVRSSTRSQVWIDGELFIDEELACNLSSDVTHLVVGSDSSFGHQVLAKIDDFAVFDEALGKNDLVALANGESPLRVAWPSPPVIVEHPQDRVIEWGSSTTFQIQAEGSGAQPLRYQWYRGDSPIEGAESSVLVLDDASELSSGSYRVVVSDIAGQQVTSRPVTLTVRPKPPLHVNEHPSDSTIIEGSSITLTVAASGLSPLEYQWFLNGSLVSEARSASLTIQKASFEESGRYHVVVTDSSGQKVTSEVGQLTVLPRPKRPQNDHFEQRAMIEGIKARIQGSNENATNQEGEPNHARLITHSSVWWKWSAPLDGTVSLTTLHSEVDTILAVYTGSSWTALEEVASNDDSQEGGTHSQLQWEAKEGTEYQIAVDSFGEQTGEIVLSLELKPILPKLSISLSGRNLILIWPKKSLNLVVEVTGSLANPRWEELDTVPVHTETEYLAKIPIGPSTQFFRLNLPD